MALLESYATQLPPLYETDQGAIRVQETRVSLDTVIYCYNSDKTPESIAQSYDTLKLRDVYAVIAYYLDNREGVDAYIQRREAEAAALRQEIGANQPSNAEFRACLEARRTAREGSS